MITGYTIEKENGEDILFLHLNYDREFGIDFGLKHKYISMKEEINKFLKKRKIKFKGSKIVLMLGGIAMATLLMTSNKFINLDDNLVYANNNLTEQIEVLNKNKDLQVEKEEIKTEQTTENEVINNKVTTQNDNKVSNNISNNDISDKENITSSIDEDNNQVETSNETLVTVYRTNGSVITLALEEYLIGVVGTEMPASFEVEALKAQDVVARTYALKKIASGTKLTDSVGTQSYKDNSELKKMWGKDYNKFYEKVKGAVLATSGLTVKYNGSYIEALYHSTSNGKTEDAVNVWGNSVPYLKSVSSEWDLAASSYLRTIDKDSAQVLKIFGLDVLDSTQIEIVRNNNGRVNTIKVGDKTYSGVEFRTLMGLRSTDFDISIESGILKITTRGYGHGVGMSQYGANGMAQAGYNFNQILNHYYQGVSVS